MSQENDSTKVKRFTYQRPTLEIKVHPPEVIELDEETIAIARTRFAGLDFENIYGNEDHSSSELVVRVQSRKIRDLFETTNNLKFAFSSEQKRAQALRDMVIDGIDLEYIKSYCRKKQWNFSDDAEALIQVGFGNDKSGETDV